MATSPFLRKFHPARSKIAPSVVQVGKPTVLPPAPRCFGRERKWEDLVTALPAEDPQPIPILGPPGIGKTTISLAALHDPHVVQRYGARRHFIRCDAIKTREALAAQVGLAVGLEPGPNIEPAVMTALGSAPQFWSLTMQKRHGTRTRYASRSFWVKSLASPK